ncbi:hypothetical protein [Mycobacteroides abscessus]|nr:hypothetical protein [Mycobacteroides abscessus]
MSIDTAQRETAAVVVEDKWELSVASIKVVYESDLISGTGVS